MYVCVYAFGGKKKISSKLKKKNSNLFSLRTNQTLDKHVGDSTDSDNEEKEGRIYTKVGKKTEYIYIY